jgi:N-acetylglucosamine-6-phosphate deacetylase
MTARTAITSARIFDGLLWHDGQTLLLDGGTITGILPENDLPADTETIDAKGQLLVPGFIDLQVNGGGGVMLNDRQDADAIRTICAAHAQFGTTALLPTLITDTFEVRAKTIEGGKQAKVEAVPGFLGLHLEGPHLSVARKGAHDPALIRPMDQADLDAMLSCADVFEAMMVTVAPENTTAAQVKALADAGIVVSLGHTDAGYKTVVEYAQAGARTVTHLFNAMSPLSHREPGVVGGALDTGSLYAGIIADGFHVDPVSMGVALRAKNGPGRIFIVTDAMSTIGSDQTSFLLNGREIFRKDGRLTLADGTLAGADIDMLSSVRFAHEKLNLSLDEAIRMASAYPADAIGIAARKGRLLPGLDADFVLLTEGLGMASTWIGGKRVFQA